MKRFRDKRKVVSLSIVGIAYALIVLPLVINNLQKQQELRTHAQVEKTKMAAAVTDVPATCGNVTTDVMLVIDHSASMSQANKLTLAKNSAKNFIDVVAGQESETRVGLVSFSTTGTLHSPLSTDYTTIKNNVDTLTASGNSCQECGIAEANKELATNGRTDVKKVVIMLTDGQANWIVGGTGQVSATIGEQKALDAVKSGFAADQTVFFSIGLGDTTGGNDGKFFSPEYMRQVAALTGGKFYFPAPSELNGVYQEISQLIGKGLLGGFIFNDANLNGIFDANEERLSGWTVKMTPSSGGPTKTATSDTVGNYTFQGLCDGTYQLTQDKKAGWTQTLPANNAGYTVTVTKASQSNDKHFGNTDKTRCSDSIDNDNNGFKDIDDSSCHTDGNPKNPNSYDREKDGEHGNENGENTCADSKDNNGNGLIDGGDPVCHTDENPQNKNSYDKTLPEKNTTQLGLTVFLDGIGYRGDNTNPAESNLSNKNPQHPTINADVQVVDNANKLVASSTGILTYTNTTGNYKGTIALKKDLQNGLYIVKVRTPHHLQKQLSGIQTFTAQINMLPEAALVTGDINDDNMLNILDFNLLLDCYTTVTEPPNCATPEKNAAADGNDDGKVNEIDYNLFLREIITQPGK